eukprot:TRINITY_DN15905_c0_g1::TRINITY_DN15905_c0_g1_i1::g.22537::m.22537 TRINITY_DN15905_c0_g1::TRINITY_DN15905_c0_g1_i1::g.22537  ORF type:complete len:188 (-),score=23.02,sp/O97508/THIO_HORSE/46.53/2e-26,Thioredoxin/PF00085.15/3.1e-27,Thioredoxin_8/PF13905.1/1.7e-06,Thioredoxin_2/PF13098.1/3.6e+03,Thioredoxin_2/PF13098.1/1.8e-05,Thioredoxin_9/PF14595.1/4e-05,Thioredoxin_7/PF13899.1/0.00037,TraF/PF13728.1/0.0012,AhpC-TSA/PF00578.16/0.0022,Redoxin/PF08534.5/0.011,Glutaredoxin/PF00462.19/0.023,DUF836/PF
MGVSSCSARDQSMTSAFCLSLLKNELRPAVRLTTALSRSARVASVSVPLFSRSACTLKRSTLTLQTVAHLRPTTRTFATAGSRVNVIEDKATFDNLTNSAKNNLVVAYFTASWCGPCKMIAPAIDEFSKTYSNVTFLKIDVDQNDDLAASFNISAVPSFHFLKNGKSVDVRMGADRKAIEQAIKDNQ